MNIEDVGVDGKDKKEKRRKKRDDAVRCFPAYIAPMYPLDIYI